MTLGRPRYPAHRFPQPPHATRVYRNIAITFLALAMVVGGVAIWLSSAHAEIRIHVKHDNADIETVVDVAKSPEQGQLRGRVVDGVFDTIREFTVKETQAAPTIVATTTGRVRITNTYSKAQPLIRQTRLLTPDGKLFRINATVNVPSGGTVEVDAYSDQAGEAFLIPVGTKFTIPGLWIDLQPLIFAEAITAFSAMAGKPGKVVTAESIAEAHATLQDAVVEQAKETLAAEAGIPPERLASDCPSTEDCWEAVYLVKVVDKKTNVSAGQQSDTFLAQVKANVTAVLYPKKDMQLLVRTKLKERLPDGRDIVDFDPAKVIYTLKEAEPEREIAHITVRAEATSRLTDQSPTLSKEALAGLAVDDARRQISAVEGVEFAEITLRPSWARRIPSQKDKINITIE